MKVVLLCAGYATRMGPLTRDVPKPLLEVAGAPILSHLVERCAALPEVDEIAVVGNHRFHAPLAAWAGRTRARIPIRLLDDGSTDESNRLGAIGDLAFAARELPLAGHDALVAAGDNLVLFDLAPLAQAFAARPAPQLAVRRVPADARRARYGEVVLDASGRVTRFREKPADPTSDLANIALYFLPAATWPLLERYLAEGGNPDAPGHFIAWLSRETAVYAEPIPGPWWDIGDLASLADARARAPSAARIRALREDEWQLLRELRLRALRDSPDAFSPLADDVAREPDEYWKSGARRLARGAARLFVAERDGRAVGLVSATPAGSTGYIGAMWVDPAARGAGAGHALLDAACTALRARGCAALALTVTETNADAIALYERAGFRRTGEWKPLRDGSPLRNLEMVATSGSG